MKKNIITLSVLFLIIQSCSRADYLKNYNNTSDFSFGAGTESTGSYNSSINTFYDTIKVSKTTQYSKNITINNTEGIKDVVVSNGLTSNNCTISNKTISLSINTKGLDNATEDIVLTINYINGNIKKLYFKLYTFKNLLPVADMAYDPNTNILNFGSSYDSDNRFGGKISEYQVTINGVVRKRNNIPNFLMAPINSIVPGKSYNVKLEIFDNDEAIASIEKTINL